MNRDRIIAVILALLLLVSLAGNWLLWKKSRGAAGPAAVAEARPEGRISPPSERGDPALYEVVANPEMKGRLGRIVLNFAEGASIAETRTTTHKAGGSEMLRADYGVVVAEMPPGTYDLEVSGKKISGIPVESGKDTRVRSGVLRTHGSKQTRMTISDVGSKSTFHVVYGNAEFGLPVGEYEIEISGQREKVTIEAGKVTDF